MDTSNRQHYYFITEWKFPIPLLPIWNTLYQTTEWPKWWQGVRSVEPVLVTDVETPIGTTHRFQMRSVLPYTLNFDMELTQLIPFQTIQAKACGDLEGIGTWQFSEQDNQSTCTFHWQVQTRIPWMNWMPSVIKPLWIWNHHQLMHQGGKGLANHLNTQLLDANTVTKNRHPVNKQKQPRIHIKRR